MATITLKVSSTNEEIQLDEIKVEEVTNKQFIDELVNGGTIPQAKAGETYYLLNKDNKIEMDEKTLKQMGYSDGDTITLLSKGTGA